MLSRLARLSRDSIIYGLGGAAVRYTGLILLPVYTRAFTTGDYGILESVSNLGALLVALAMLGLDGAVPLLFYETEDLQQRRRICTLWVWLTVVVAAPVTLLLIVLGDWVSLVASGTTANGDLFRLGIAVLPFALLQAIFSHILRLTFRSRLYALLNFGLTTLIAILSIYLVVFRNMGPAGALWGVLLGTAAAAIASAWAVGDTVRLLDFAGGVRPIAQRLLRLGLPLVPASVALWVISFSNTYFLIQIAGPEEAGVFRVGARLAALLGLGVWAFQLAWGPYSLAAAREPDAPRLYSLVATLYTAGSVGASVALAAFAPVLLAIFATGDYAAASSVIGLQALSAAALGAYYVVAIGVNLAQRTGQIAWTTLVAAGANLLLNALLIPVWGIIGAGLASLAANLTSAALVYLMSQRFYPLPYRPYRLLAVWLAGSACVAAAGVFNVVVRPSIWPAAAFAVVVSLAYVAALFATSAVTVRDVLVARNALGGLIGRRGATTVDPAANPGSAVQTLRSSTRQLLFDAYKAATARPPLALAVLTVLAFVLRVAFMLAARSLTAPPVEDALEYHNLALNMLAGEGYSLDGTPIVNRAPAFPVFLALVYSLFGASPAAARVVLAFMVSLLVPLIFYIGKRGWGAGVGWLAAALFAVYPFSIFWGQYLITENLLVVLFVVLGVLLVKPEAASPLRLFGGGITVGLSLLTRPTALPVVAGLFVWLLFALRGPRRLALSFGLLLLGAALAMSPWIARNYSTYGQFIPFTSGFGSSAGGYVFWISNNSFTAQPGERWGRYVAAEMLPEYEEYTALPNDPALLDRKGYEYGLRYFVQHPGEVPVLLLGKFLRFWNVFPGAQLYTRAVGALALLLLPFFLVGLRAAWRRPESGGMLLAFIVGTMLIGLIFWADTRTRAPAEPLILLTSAVGALYMARRFTARQASETRNPHDI